MGPSPARAQTNESYGAHSVFGIGIHRSSDGGSRRFERLGSGRRGVDPAIVGKVNRGEIHIVEPGLAEAVREAVSAGRLRASLEPVPGDVYVVVVPTPFKGNHEPDVSYVEAATRSVVPLLKEDDLFVIESTSPVGTTDRMARLIFAERPELEGKLSVAYCPERVLPGNVLYELVHNDRVIGGIDDRSTRRAMEFYARFVEGKLHATDAKTAEMCKLTENSSRDVQIAFANELSLICDKAGINVWELIELANKHPRVHILQPGSGVGGHCIAVDPYFITSEFPVESQLIAKSREINNYKAFWCAERIREAVRGFKVREGRPPRVALMGLAFKPDIDDLRESPAKYIVSKVMEAEDADYMIVEPNVREHRVYKLTDYAEAYAQADIVAFLVAHAPFRSLAYRDDAVILDFCGIFRK